MDEVAPEDRAAISAIDVQEFHDQDGKVIRRVHKIRLEKKQPPLETLGRISGLLPSPRGYEGAYFGDFTINVHTDLPPTGWRRPRYRPLNLGFLVVVGTTAMHAVVRARQLTGEG